MSDDRASVLAEVVDQGEGIRRADIPKLFEPFFTTKAPGRGTGLGLSICYAIVAEHGGRIEVDSAPGEGSVFRILLPRATDNGEQQ
jgi:two-component system, NtrC family, sensor kinase